VSIHPGRVVALNDVNELSKAVEDELLAHRHVHAGVLIVEEVADDGDRKGHEHHAAVDTAHSDAHTHNRRRVEVAVSHSGPVRWTCVHIGI
jgi:hypothetical protein